MVDLLHHVIHVGHKESACFIKWISPTQVMTFNYYDIRVDQRTLVMTQPPSPQQGLSTIVPNKDVTFALSIVIALLVCGVFGWP